MRSKLVVFLGYAAIAVLSLIASIVSSFFVCAFLKPWRGGGAPGDGFGYIIIQWFVLPAWALLATILPYLARTYVKGRLLSLKRASLCFLTPPIMAAIIAAVLTPMLY